MQYDWSSFLRSLTLLIYVAEASSTTAMGAAIMLNVDSAEEVLIEPNKHKNSNTVG